MFKDCKTGGYNLEGSQASPEKLSRLILLIALAMTRLGYKAKELSYKDNKNMSVEFKSQVELEGDIATFGLGFMERTG